MIDRLDRHVDRAVAADGDVSAVEIIVDGGGDADHRKLVFADDMRTGLRTVSADHHQTVDTVLGEVVQRAALTGLLAKLFRASATQKRAADLDDAADVARSQRADVVVDEALPAMAHAVDGDVAVERAAGDGTDGGVHARSIA